MDKQAKSDVKSPSLTGMDLVPKLGGMPKTLSVDQVIKANEPNSRTPAPDSFRPSERSSQGDKA